MSGAPEPVAGAGGGRGPVAAGVWPAPAPGARAPVRCVLRVRGRVQGVGFRPFVYREAVASGLRGGVWNDLAGAVVDVEGDARDIERLRDAILQRAPGAARVDRVEALRAPLLAPARFEIRPSVEGAGPRGRGAPDLATCAACLAELRDPRDRRFGYPFLCCTDCGPRDSITRALPYDRERTTMARFRMCPACADEYADPGSRRFHAQPNACPRCGPRLWLERTAGARERFAQPAGAAATSAVARSGAQPAGAAPLPEAVALLRAGGLLALKGLGGFQLACDARSDAAVQRLRDRKRRPAKPLAVMFASLEALVPEVHAGAREREALTSVRAPIVLLRRREASRLASGIAPGLREIGVLLPYTPLHHRLLDAFGGPLVMTSGNLADDPLAATNDEARERLAGVADALLLHDREIHARADDSLVRVVAGRERVLRRARGYVPDALPLPFDAPPLLAVGADLKNALCLCEGRRAVLGPHVGDLASWESIRWFHATRARLEALLGIRPSAIAHDLHPSSHGTRLARESGLPALAVQHHHAHVAACLVEHGRSGRVIGVAWDGTGYGPDGSIWGGELLVADLAGFRRRGRLRPVALPGGAAAIREPWRMAVAHARASGVPGCGVGVPGVASLDAMIRGRVGTPLTSSAGRLFDAVAALLGLRTHADYEGQAAAELEALCEDGDEGPPYPLPLHRRASLLELDPRPLIRAVVRDRERGLAAGRIAARFHAALASGIARSCRALRDRTRIGTVALTGGCFQNRRLLTGALRELSQAGFEVLLHERVPTGDGGLALGQAAVAAWRMRDVSGHPR